MSAPPRPASDKQLALILKLSAEKVLDGIPAPDLNALTMREASALIDRLFAAKSLPKPPEPMTDVGTAFAASEPMRTGRVHVTVVTPDGEHVALRISAWRGPKRDNPTIDDPVIRYYIRGGRYADALGSIRADNARLWTEKWVSDEVRKAVEAFMDHALGHPTSGYTFEFEVRCAVCGSALTDPESITRGIGPTCYGKVTKSKALAITEPGS